MKNVLCFFILAASVEAQQLSFSDVSVTDWKLVCPPIPEEEDDKPGETIDPDCINEARKKLKKENKQLQQQLIEQDLIRIEEIKKLNETIEELIITSGPGEKGKSTNVWQAAQDGNLPAVVFYINQDPSNLNKQKENDKYKKTALIFATANNHLKIVEFLVRRGASIDGVNSANETALVYASNQGYTSILKYLISKGANLNIQNEEKWTPLHWAVFGNQLDTLKVLIQNGADSNIKDENDKTPLDLAKQEGKNDMVEFLMSI